MFQVTINIESIQTIVLNNAYSWDKTQLEVQVDIAMAESQKLCWSQTGPENYVQIKIFFFIEPRFPCQSF